MKTRVIISIVFVGLGLILAAVPQNTTLPYRLTAEQMLEETNNRVMYFTPEEVADIIIQKDPEYQLIDVRSPDEYDKFSLPNSINIPLNDILSEDYRDYLDQDAKRNIFYSNGTVSSVKAWMITRQLGWSNNYVLEGGLNYWAEVIMNPEKPSDISPNEEIARYQFRKGANQVLSGEAVTSNQSSSTDKPKPPIIRTKKKKRVEGGC